MMIIKRSTTTTTTSIVFFALLLSLMSVFAFPKLEKLGPICDHINLKNAFKDCLTVTLKKGRLDSNVCHGKAFCCNIAKYRICVDAAVWEYCEKKINQVYFLQSIVSTTEIQYGITDFEKKCCGVAGAQINDCFNIKKDFTKALFALAIVGFAFFFIYNMRSTVLHFGYRLWLVLGKVV